MDDQVALDMVELLTVNNRQRCPGKEEEEGKSCDHVVKIKDVANLTDFVSTPLKMPASG